MDEFITKIKDAVKPSRDQRQKIQNLFNYFEEDKNQTIDFFIEALTNPEIRESVGNIIFQNIIIFSVKLFPKNITQRTENPFSEIDPSKVRILFNALVQICIDFPSTTGSIASLQLPVLIQNDIHFNSGLGFEADVIELFFDPQNADAQANFTNLLSLVISTIYIDDETSYNILLRVRELISSSPNEYLSTQLERLLSKLVENTNIIESGEEQSSLVIQSYVELLSNEYTKSTTYAELTEIIEDYYPLFKAFGQSIIEESISDIDTYSQEKSTVNNILDFWKEMCVCERKAKESFGFIEHNSEAIVSILISIISAVDSDEVHCTEENEPNINAGKVLSKIIKMNIAHRFLIEKLPSFMQSDNLGEQDCAFTIIANMLYFGNLSPFVSDILSFVSQGLQSDFQRIRENSVIIVDDLIDIIVHHKQPLLDPFMEKIYENLMAFAEPIFEIMTNDQLSSKTACKTLIDYMSLPNFTGSAQVLSNILESVCSENAAISRECVLSLSTICEKQTDDIVLAAYSGILDVLEQNCETDDDETHSFVITEILCDLPQFIERLKDKIDETFVARSFELLSAIAEEKQKFLEYTLVPLSTLAVCSGELFNDCLEDTIHLFVECLGQKQYPVLIENSCKALLMIGGQFDLESVAADLLQMCVETMSEQLLLSTKSFVASLMALSIDLSPENFVENAEDVVRILISASEEFDTVRTQQEKKRLTKEDVTETQIEASRFLRAFNAVFRAFIETNTDISESVQLFLDVFLMFAGLPSIIEPDFVSEMIELAYLLLSNFPDETKEVLMMCDGLLQSIRVASESHICEEKSQEITSFFAQ